MDRCRISIPFSIVTPTTGDSTPCCSAIAATRFAFAVEIRMREGASWNARNSGRRSESISSCAPMPFGPKEHSASATASPPSLKSCADSASPSERISRIASCTRFSYSISSAGGCPHSCFRISLAYSVPPKSQIVARAHPADQHHRAVSVLERDRDGLGRRQRADNPHHGRWINAFAERLVVQADVAASDRSIEETASLGRCPRSPPPAAP